MGCGQLGQFRGLDEGTLAYNVCALCMHGFLFYDGLAWRGLHGRLRALAWLGLSREAWRFAGRFSLRGLCATLAHLAGLERGYPAGSNLKPTG